MRVAKQAFAGRSQVDKRRFLDRSRIISFVKPAIRSGDITPSSIKACIPGRSFTESLAFVPSIEHQSDHVVPHAIRSQTSGVCSDNSVPPNWQRFADRRRHRPLDSQVGFQSNGKRYIDALYLRLEVRPHIISADISTTAWPPQTSKPNRTSGKSQSDLWVLRKETLQGLLRHVSMPFQKPERTP